MKLSEVSNFVRGVRDYHDACLRNGLRVPDLKSRICTIDFLKKCRTGEIWVPKFEILVVRPCVNSPTAKQIQIELVSVL
jgi:hypothetical protein